MRRVRPALLSTLGLGLAAAVCCGGPATLVKALLNGFDDFKAVGETESWTVAEARDRGVLVEELALVPAELDVPGGRVRFGEAWVEERALSGHRLVWLPSEERVGGYRLHFTLAEGKELLEASGLRFYRDDVSGVSVGGHLRTGGRHLYVKRLDGPDVSGLRLSLARSSDAPRAKGIRFTRKPGL
jgi:hypothetical protein